MGGFQVREQAPKPPAKAKLRPAGPKPPAPPRPPAPGPRCPHDLLVLTPRIEGKTVEAGLKRRAAAAKTPAEAMDVFDAAHEMGLKGAATAAIKRAADLCDNQREGLQVAKTADFLGYREAADYAYKIVEGLPSSLDFPF